jgi:hypothetical protein
VLNGLPILTLLLTYNHCRNVNTYTQRKDSITKNASSSLLQVLTGLVVHLKYVKTHIDKKNYTIQSKNTFDEQTEALTKQQRVKTC